MQELEIVLEVVLSTLTLLPTAATIEAPQWRSVIVTPRRGCRVILRDRY
jgi:hypothetical protein